MQTTNEARDSVLSGLQDLIIYHLKNQANEEQYPSSNPDKMDDIIKNAKETVANLRLLRIQFENIISGVCI